MKKRYFLTALLLIMFVASAIAQPGTKFTGTWYGILNVGGQLHLVFHINENAGGSLLSTLDSPDQAAYGMKCDTTFINGATLTIEMHNLHAAFTGKLVNDSTLEGNFNQGVDFPLVLGRKKENPAPLLKQTLIHDLSYKNIDVTVRAKNVTLSGTLFQPLNHKNSPVVLIISGSGPTDRDGNSILLPGKNNSLLQLADSLAQYGIATLRYDKRGIGKSKPDTLLDEESLTINDIADDAQAMYEWLKKQGYNDIYVAGHSEGSLVGMMTAAKVNPKGFISMAGAGRKAGDILREQTAGQLSPALKKEFDNAIDSLERGMTVTSVNPSLMNLLRPSIQPYMRSWLSLDPQKIISRLKCPVLIVQGTKDLQVKERDARDLYKASQNSKLAIIKNMNHVLKQVDSDQVNDNVKAYSDPDLPVIKELITAIVNFITQPAP
jgi:uncharacterized protein